MRSLGQNNSPVERSGFGKAAMGKAFIAALLLLVPALLFFAFSDRGDDRWTAQSQIFHGGIDFIEAEEARLNSVELLTPVAEAEGLSLEELQQDWDAGIVTDDFFATDRPDTQLLKLEFVNEDPGRTLRVVTAITNAYLADAVPLANLDDTRRQLLELEESHLVALSELLARIETLDADTVAFDDARSTQATLEDAIVDVRELREEVNDTDRVMIGSELVASPFLLPQESSNAVSQTLLGLALGVLLAGSFLVLVHYGERRSTENLSRRSANAQEAPRASQQ